MEFLLTGTDILLLETIVWSCQELFYLGGVFEFQRVLLSFQSKCCFSCRLVQIVGARTKCDHCSKNGYSKRVLSGGVSCGSSR